MRFSDYRKARTHVPAYPAEQSELLAWVHLSQDCGALPLVVRPQRSFDAAAWLAAAAPSMHSLADQHGALLLRGFAVGGAIDMERCVRSLVGELADDRENTSPRTFVHGRIQTSTEYPATESIVMHNEYSYSRVVPLRVFFHCVTPAGNGGCTPIADCARVRNRIDAGILRRFRKLGWLYVRNFVPGFGLSWQTVYRCTQRSALEAQLRGNDIGWSWSDTGQLRTVIRRPAEERHPRTGEWLWFNHILFWNIVSLPADMQRILLADFARSDLPHNTYYGDGTPIEAGVLEEIRQAYAAERRQFTWEAGDLLILDNLKVAHAREPYVGKRELLFAMGQPFDRRGGDGWTACGLT